MPDPRLRFPDRLRALFAPKFTKVNPPPPARPEDLTTAHERAADVARDVGTRLVAVDERGRCQVAGDAGGRRGRRSLRRFAAAAGSPSSRRSAVGAGRRRCHVLCPGGVRRSRAGLAAPEREEPG